MIRTTNDVMRTLPIQASPRFSGRRAFTPPPTFSTVFLPLLLLLRLLTTLFSVPLPLTLTFVSSGASATRTLLLLLLISSHLARHVVCSLVTPLIIRGTGATISPLVGFLYPDMLCLTSQTSPFPPPPHPLRILTLSPCFLTWWCIRLFLFFLFKQVLLVHHRLWLLRWRLSFLHHPRLQCYSSHRMWAWCLRPHHVWPRCPRRPSERTL
jgi:hypothetical protein